MDYLTVMSFKSTTPFILRVRSEIEIRRGWKQGSGAFCGDKAVMMDDEGEGSVVTLMESVVTVAAVVESAEFKRVEDEIGLHEEMEGDVEENVEDVEKDEEDGNSEDYQLGGYLKVLNDSSLVKTKRTVLGKR